MLKNVVTLASLEYPLIESYAKIIAPRFHTKKFSALLLAESLLNQPVINWKFQYKTAFSPTLMVITCFLATSTIREMQFLRANQSAITAISSPHHSFSR